jgi:hypothetical protein
MTSRWSPSAVRGLLRLFEQPDVLDRDEGLVGKGLKQCDLVVGETTGLAACERKCAGRLVVTEHRYDHHASNSARTGDRAICVCHADISRPFR